MYLLPLQRSTVEYGGLNDGALERLICPNFLIKLMHTLDRPIRPSEKKNLLNFIVENCRNERSLLITHWTCLILLLESTLLNQQGLLFSVSSMRRNDTIFRRRRETIKYSTNSTNHLDSIHLIVSYNMIHMARTISTIHLKEL